MSPLAPGCLPLSGLSFLFGVESFLFQGIGPAPSLGPPRICSLGLCLPPAESHLSLLYHLTAVSSPAPGAPAFWVSGWLGPQQYLSYNNLRAEAEPCGAWVWENQVSWYWEKETTDLRSKQELFLEGLKALGKGGKNRTPGV